MKILDVLTIVLFAGLLATQSFADIHFVFKHSPSPANANLPSSLLPTLYIGAKKEHGAHLAQSESASNQRNELHPGESSEDYVISSLFASDPTGAYEIAINCYLRKEDTKMKSWKGFTKTISLPKDGSTVRIEAECPIINEKGAYNISSPENIIIKVDNDFIIGAPTQ